MAKETMGMVIKFMTLIRMFIMDPDQVGKTVIHFVYMISFHMIISSVRSSKSHPDLLLTHPLFQITPVLNTGLSLSEPLQLYKGYNAI